MAIRIQIDETRTLIDVSGSDAAAALDRLTTVLSALRALGSAECDAVKVKALFGAQLAPIDPEDLPAK